MDTFPIEESERAGSIFAQWALWTILAVVLAWDNLADSQSRYVVYALPLLVVVIHLVIYRFRPCIDGGGFAALTIYAVAAVASLMVNPHLDPFARRDLLIIFGYLVLFSLHLRAPALTADVILIGLFAGLAIEIAQKGFVPSFAVFGAQGIIESNLAFPVGVLLLYYLNERRWGRALLASVFLIIASKRIAMFGVLAATGLEVLTYRLTPVLRRRLFITAVVLCVLVALFSEQAFNYLAQLTNTDGNEVSLGRYSFASVLWERLSPAGFSHWLFGFGPGAADGWLAHQGIPANPHNDWLKILFDYGLFGLVLLVVAFGVLFPRKRLTNKIYLYVAVLMITDNTFIYLYYFAIVFLISRIAPEVVARPATLSTPVLGQQQAI